MTVDVTKASCHLCEGLVEIINDKFYGIKCKEVPNISERSFYLWLSKLTTDCEIPDELVCSFPGNVVSNPFVTNENLNCNLTLTDITSTVSCSVISVTVIK